MRIVQIQVLNRSVIKLLSRRWSLVDCSFLDHAGSFCLCNGILAAAFVLGCAWLTLVLKHWQDRTWWQDDLPLPSHLIVEGHRSLGSLGLLGPLQLLPFEQAKAGHRHKSSPSALSSASSSTSSCARRSQSSKPEDKSLCSAWPDFAHRSCASGKATLQRPQQLLDSWPLPPAAHRQRLESAPQRCEASDLGSSCAAAHRFFSFFSSSAAFFAAVFFAMSSTKGMIMPSIRLPVVMLWDILRALWSCWAMPYACCRTKKGWAFWNLGPRPAPALQPWLNLREPWIELPTRQGRSEEECSSWSQEEQAWKHQRCCHQWLQRAAGGSHEQRTKMLLWQSAWWHFPQGSACQSSLWIKSEPTSARTLLHDKSNRPNDQRNMLQATKATC